MGRPPTLSLIAPPGSYLSSRISTRWLSGFGLLITACGYFAFSFLDTSWNRYSTRNRNALAHDVSPEETTAQLLGVPYAYLIMAGLVPTGAVISFSRGKTTRPSLPVTVPDAAS